LQNNGLILFATGRDRPGIVDRIAGLAYRSGANLEDSRMAVLGGEFALVVLLTGSPDALGKVRSGMPEIAGELGLTVHFKETTAGPEARRLPGPHLRYRVQGVSMDHPGIVHKVTHVLAQNGVNVARLDTSLSNAPVTGTPVFSIEIEVEVPASLPLSSLRAQLQKVADEENIDLDLRAVEG
jgi:glycine cleavage system transcriptional repressor